MLNISLCCFFFFFQAEDGIRDIGVTGVQTCALPISTHIDKDHIHNHIIFNSIDVDEGKVYHSYYGSYMNIRNQSDRICKEHSLSVIDQETQREINEIKRRKFVNWYDWNEDKKGSSYKSRRSEEHTSELQSRQYLVCRLLLEKKKQY